MAFPIRHDFCERSLALIRGRLWNKVARICSYWASGTGIALVKPETPTPESPIVIGLNPVEAAPAIAREFDTQELWGESKSNGATGLALTSGHKEGRWTSEDRVTGDKEKWSRGSTKDGSDKPCGFTVLLPCRLKHDGIDGMLRWRKFTFDERGRCVSVGEEDEAYSVVVTRVERES